MLAAAHLLEHGELTHLDEVAVTGGGGGLDLLLEELGGKVLLRVLVHARQIRGVDLRRARRAALHRIARLGPLDMVVDIALGQLGAAQLVLDAGGDALVEAELLRLLCRLEPLGGLLHLDLAILGVARHAELRRAGHVRLTDGALEVVDVDLVRLGRRRHRRVDRLDGRLALLGRLVLDAHPEDAPTSKRVLEVLHRDAVDLIEAHLVLEPLHKFAALLGGDAAAPHVDEEEEDDDGDHQVEDTAGREVRDAREDREDDVKVRDQEGDQGDELHQVGRDDALAIPILLLPLLLLVLLLAAAHRGQWARRASGWRRVGTETRLKR